MGDAGRLPAAELLTAFTALRTANLVLIRETPVAWWDRLGIHEERGPTSFRLATETIAGHDRAHLLQLDQTITALQRCAPPAPCHTSTPTGYSGVDRNRDGDVLTPGAVGPGGIPAG